MRILTGILNNSVSGGSPTLKAFPDAIAWDPFAITGGRGGDVYIVSNLNISGPGSFEEAVRKTDLLPENRSNPRNVVFTVGGVIDHSNANIVLDESNISVWGSTAPGDGICIKGVINGKASNVIIQNITVRIYSSSASIDGMNVVTGTGNTLQNIIYDRCSISWATDGGADANAQNGTLLNFQWNRCIIAQTCEGHSLASLSDSGNYVGWALCAFVDNAGRLPTANNGNVAEGKVCNIFIINCMAYDWNSRGSEMTDVKVDYWYNDYRPCTVSTALYDVPGTSNASNAARLGLGTTAFAEGNNMTIDDTGYTPSATPNHPEMEQYVIKNLATAETVLLDEVGAKPRHSLDVNYLDRLINATNNGRITRETLVLGSGAGGIDYPSYASGTTPTDTNSDGLPDIYETYRGVGVGTLTPNGIAPSGYTNIEDYAWQILQGNITL